MEQRFNTMSPGFRPTSVPTGILIHPAVWLQQRWIEIGDWIPFGGQLGPHLTQRGWGRGLPPRWVSSWSIRLATIHQSHTDRQDRTGQRPQDWLHSFMTGPFLLSISVIIFSFLVFIFSFFIILFCLVPCGRFSWLCVSFWAHINIIVSYRIVMDR